MSLRCFEHRRDGCAECDATRKRKFDETHHYTCGECLATFTWREGEAPVFLQKATAYHPCTRERRHKERARTEKALRTREAVRQRRAFTPCLCAGEWANYETPSNDVCGACGGRKP